MPSKNDKAFIDNLQNFTSTLEGLVELLKKQVEKGDAINQMLSSMDGPSMAEISDDIKVLVEKTDKIDSRTKQILEEIKTSKREKEGGVFGKVSDTKNKGKIVDGIGVIMLIAGGVLAIGMAFKLVGNIDIMSVIALGIAIYAVSKAFAEIASIKNLTMKTALIAGGVMVVIAGALVASSFILTKMQSIDMFAAFSMILVGGALGLASMLLMKSISKIDINLKTMGAIAALPLILPLIAGGIVLSSHIIKYMADIDLKQGLSFALLGGVLGIAAYILLKSISKIDLKKNMLNILMLPLILPIISGAIVLSSIILNQFKELENPKAFIKTALSIGLGVAAFLPVFWAVNKFKIDPMKAAMGGLVVVIAATAIMVSSYILGLGKYDKYPSAKWAAGAGLAMILFTPSLVVFGILAASGIGLIALALGAVGAVITAGAIVAVSEILDKGSYTDGPPLDWAVSIGLLLPIFGASMVAVALIPFGGKLLGRGAKMVGVVAQTIVDTAAILKGGDYTGGPNKDWAEGIGLSLGAFSSALGVAMGTSGGIFNKSKMKPEDFVTFIKNVSEGMIAAAEILKKGDWSTNAPSKAWGEGVGAGLAPFIDIFSMLTSAPKARKLMKDLSNSKDGDNAFSSLIVSIASSMVAVNKTFGNTEWTNYPTKEWSAGVKDAYDAIASIGGADDKIIDGIDKFSDAIQKLTNSFNGLKSTGIDKFSRLSGSVTILSAVDPHQLGNIIGVLNNNKEKLGDVTREASRGSNPSSKSVKNSQEKIQSTLSKANKYELTQGEKMMAEKFDTVLSKFDEVLENMIKDEQGKDAGDKDTVG